MKTDSWLINLPKNVVQYLIGFSLYLLVYGSFDPIKLVLGLSSFLITYSAIYPYNDLMDYESDKKDKFKKVYKALVRGDLSQKSAISMVFGLPVIGLIIASMVSQWYMFLLMILLFQNFLHSSPSTTGIFKKKKRYMLPNMLLMQLIKFTLGWFTFTTDLTRLPGWMILTLGLGYIYGYFLYKTDIKDMKSAMIKKIKIILPLSILTVGSYVISFLIYPYKVPLLLLIPLLLMIFTMSKQKDVVKKTFRLSSITILIIAGLMVMLLLLNVPAIAAVNNNATEFFEDIGELSLQKMDNNTYNIIYKINKSIYTYPLQDLKDLDKIFNVTSKQVVLRNETNIP